MSTTISVCRIQENYFITYNGDIPKHSKSFKSSWEAGIAVNKIIKKRDRLLKHLEELTAKKLHELSHFQAKGGNNHA